MGKWIIEWSGDMFKEQDTSWLQLESVIKCAKALGYEFNGRSFYTYTRPIGSRSKKKHYLSFNDMQEIHNAEAYYEDYYFNTVSVKVGFQEDKKLGFVYSKIVEKSTLQWHKKKKQFIAQNNMVKFV